MEKIINSYSVRQDMSSTIFLVQEYEELMVIEFVFGVILSLVLILAIVIGRWED